MVLGRGMNEGGVATAVIVIAVAVAVAVTVSVGYVLITQRGFTGLPEHGVENVPGRRGENQPEKVGENQPSVGVFSLSVYDGEFEEVAKIFRTYVLTIPSDQKSFFFARTVPISIPSDIHSQEVRMREVHYSTEPDSIEINEIGADTTEEKATWNNLPAGEITIQENLEVLVTTSYSPLVTSTPYPIPPDSIPADVAGYLSPTVEVQSDAQEIIDLASALLENCVSEADAVVRIVNWVRYNLRWICPTCVVEEGDEFYFDALGTLQQGGGNCANFQALSLAMLRAAGIPARAVTGIPVDLTSPSETYHAWIEVYYPDLGWVQYESSYWLPRYETLPDTFRVPQHVRFEAENSVRSGHSIVEGFSFTESYERSFEVTAAPTAADNQKVSIGPGSSATFVLTLKNNSSDNENILLESSQAPSGWQVYISQSQVNLLPKWETRDSKDVAVTIKAPAGDTENTMCSIVVTATSLKDPSATDSVTLIAELLT
jgi:transglutaminase-like putative cysteine protease